MFGHYSVWLLRKKRMVPSVLPLALRLATSATTNYTSPEEPAPKRHQRIVVPIIEDKDDDHG